MRCYGKQEPQSSVFSSLPFFNVLSLSNSAEKKKKQNRFLDNVYTSVTQCWKKVIRKDFWPVIHSREGVAYSVFMDVHPIDSECVECKGYYEAILSELSTTCGYPEISLKWLSMEEEQHFDGTCLASIMKTPVGLHQRPLKHIHHIYICWETKKKKDTWTSDEKWLGLSVHLHW